MQRHALPDAHFYWPEWSDVEGYAHAYARKHLWRVAIFMELDDLMQEAYLAFMETKARYAGAVDNPKWFMSLYKTALFCAVNDLAKRAGRGRMMVYEHSLMSDTAEVPDCIGETENAATALLLWRDAPRELRQLVCLVCEASVEVSDRICTAMQRRTRKDFAYLGAIVGAPADIIRLQIVSFTAACTAV
jgi:hypothetical protein